MASVKPFPRDNREGLGQEILTRDAYKDRT